MKLAALMSGLCVAALAGTPIEIRTAELPWASVHTAYDVTIGTHADLRCGESEIVFSVVRGALPPGVEIGLDGIHGTPERAGTYPFTLRAANGCSQATREFTLTVTGKPILRVDAAEMVFEHHIGAPDPPARSVLVSSSWPEFPYSVNSASCQWLKFAQTEGRTPPAESSLSADSVSIRVLPNGLAPGRYTCNMVFSGWRAANAPVVRVRLEVVGWTTALTTAELEPEAAPEPAPTTVPQTAPAITPNL
jgi:hypothetical protein